jgi:hypothetical protein
MRLCASGICVNGCEQLFLCCVELCEMHLDLSLLDQAPRVLRIGAKQLVQYL